MEGQQAMFEVPAVYRRPKRAPKADSWQQYKGRPTSCDMCVMDLYNGAPDGPLENARTRLVRVDGDIHLLCSRHTSRVKSGDRKLGQSQRTDRK